MQDLVGGSLADQVGREGEASQPRSGGRLAPLGLTEEKTIPRQASATISPEWRGGKFDPDGGMASRLADLGKIEFLMLGMKLPVFVTRDWFADYPYLEKSLGPNDAIIDHTVTISPDVPSAKWADFYKDALKNLQPGVTEFVIHLGYANDESLAATRERDTWGAAWRQRDFDFFTSDDFRKLLHDYNIQLVNWRDVGRAMNLVSKAE